MRSIVSVGPLWLVVCLCNPTQSDEVFVAGSRYTLEPVQSAAILNDDARPIVPAPSASVLDYDARPADPARAVAAWANWGADAFPKSDWTIDYHFRGLCDSRTEYEFGTPVPPPTGYAPMSRLNFPISSCWHGLEIGLRRPTWEIRCEWMMPQQNIVGELADYDWRAADQPYTDLGFAPERFIDGQMLDVSGEFRLMERFFGLPFEFWPIGGFRWQKFNIMAYDMRQVRWMGEWLDPPYISPGDCISLNQQYAIGYVGGQFRINLPSNVLPDGTLTLQGDWGHVEAYNVDHHIQREGNRYTMDRTHGNAVHFALTAEFPVHRRVSFGVQVDHTAIKTRGTHHHYNAPMHEDWTWDNGVKVNSDQTGVMAFARLKL